VINNQKNKRNSTHGQQLTQDEKKVYALKWWGVIPDDDIKTALSISYASFDRWVKNKKDDFEEQQRKQGYDLWMRCEPLYIIEKITGISRRTVNNTITDFEEKAHNGIFANFGKNNQMLDFAKFRDFDNEDSHLKIYDIWNFSKATNEVNHFYILFFDFTTGARLCLRECVDVFVSPILKGA
jgi:hypothetical protein